MMRRLSKLFGTGLLGLIGASVPALAAQAEAAPESFESIVNDRLAIERVYALHRRGTDGERHVQRDVARRRVDDALRLTTALEELWGERITADRLEAELERMARRTRDPQRLNELFDAAGRDASRLAEALARPALVERLARAAYRRDRGMHRETLKRAHEGWRRLLRGDRLEAVLADTGGRAMEETWLRKAEEPGDPSPAADPTVRRLGPERWAARVAQLGGALGASERPGGAPLAASELPVGAWSRPVLAETRLSTVSLIGAFPGRLALRRVIWSKRPFDLWWEQARERFEPAIPVSAAAELALPQPTGARSAATGADRDENPPTGTWTLLYRSPGARRGPAAVWTGAEMIVWGGFGGGARALGDGARYDPATDTWEPLATENAPAPRQDHRAVWTGSEMIVWGGRSGDEVPLASGARYDPAEDRWTPMAETDAPVARYDHTAVWTGSEMIVWGGRNETFTPLASGGLYDPAADAWTPMTEMDTPSARYDHSAVWTGSEMIVWGGHGASGVLADGGRYAPETDAWADLAEAGAPTARERHTAVWSGERMLVWGGRDAGGGGLGDGAAHDPLAGTWSELPAEQAPGPRYDHTAVWTGSEMIVWGGQGSVEALADGAIYSPASDSWRPLGNGESTPRARSEHAAVWTGSEMIVWGGGPGLGGMLNTGGRYDPGEDTWAPTHATRPIADHTAVWTGAEMIVWGGTDGLTYVAEGERYDPATDTWTPVAMDEQTPAARGLHTAVWAGGEMIVWGGYGLDDRLDSGGRYDPEADTWTPTSDEEPPRERYRHTAVWTGTEMIIWGGQDGILLSSGYRYDPEADTWVRIPSPAIEGRTGHTAVWSGAEMIVWGGYGLEGDLDDGARYDPDEDVWTPVSTDGAPAPRRDHVAVWTGNDMLVWGGQNSSANLFLEFGGRYDPGEDTWGFISSSESTPEGRTEAVAVWTEQEMLLWGGERLDPVATGGRYDPFAQRWNEMEPPPPLLEGRYGHTGVWTSRGLIVWGGHNGHPLNDGAVYEIVYTWYPDEDQDGFGDTDEPVQAVLRPAGFSSRAGDCDDTDDAVFPGAEEINDGIDNQCPGDRGFGVVDENSGDSGFPDPEDKTLYAWDPQEGATEYEAARASDPGFDTGCAGTVTAETEWIDEEVPQAGEAFFYLNRPTAPNLGSWGTDSAGIERSGACL